MKLLRKPEEFPDTLRGGALAIGNFDGVHRGHARLVSRLKHHAEQKRGAAIVLTFDPHPVRLLRPEQAPPPLTWTNRKAELLAKLGVDAVFAYPTDDQFLGLSANQFFETIILDMVGAQAIVEGPNFHFGHRREGDVQTLAGLCEGCGIELEVVEPLRHESEYISSSRIRDLVRDGEVAMAAHLLTEPYRIRGMVTHGAARGKTIGFPTANLDAIDTLVPAKGVYAGHAFVGDQSHIAAIHVGPNPTYGEAAHKVEVHIIDFDNTVYGCPIEVDFVDRLRDIRQFNSTDELKQQLANDVVQARRIAGGES